MTPTTLIIVLGHVATGKTTISKLISKKLKIPVISFDEIKEKLFDSVGYKIGDYLWNKKLNIASDKILYYISENLLKNKIPHIIEGIFNPNIHNKKIKKLKDKYNLKIIQIQTISKKETILERHKKRYKSGERHPGHFDQKTFAEIKDTKKIDDYSYFLNVKSTKIKLNTDTNTKTKINEILETIIKKLK